MRRLLRYVLGLMLLTAMGVLVLRWLPPPTSAFMLRSWGAAVWDGRDDYRLRYQWVDQAQIATVAKLAVMASEDQLFLHHHGFDLDAIAKVWKRNRQGKHLHGASTISQQTAKNLFLYPARNLLRKGLEAYFTALLEALWPKRRILEVYLNVAQFGDGIYGIEAAAQAYFKKPAARLQPKEAAVLAAVLPNPLVLHADKPSAYVLKRRNWILGQMRQLRAP